MRVSDRDRVRLVLSFSSPTTKHCVITHLSVSTALNQQTKHLHFAEIYRVYPAGCFGVSGGRVAEANSRRFLVFQHFEKSEILIRWRRRRKFWHFRTVFHWFPFRNCVLDSLEALKNSPAAPIHHCKPLNTSKTLSNRRRRRRKKIRFWGKIMN